MHNLGFRLIVKELEVVFLLNNFQHAFAHQVEVIRTIVLFYNEFFFSKELDVKQGRKAVECHIESVTLAQQL